MLKIEHLTKKYGDKFAVNDLCLEVKAGQICAFIGHNGAGKTTTLKSICDIISFEGQIWVNDIDVRKEPMKAKQIIGYLPDNPDLYEHLKAIDYLQFIAAIYKVNKSDFEERVKTYGARLAILDALVKPIQDMSHGMKQKVALLSLLIRKPKLYLLDEPFVGLDPTASHEIKMIMQEECKAGNAIFYSTHVLEVAEKICSHVAIINDGKLVAHGELSKIRGDKSLENIFLEMGNDSKTH